MRILKWILGVFLVLLLLGFLVSLILPSKYDVKNSATINAPVNEVFAQVNNFKNWEKWSPWAKQDPSMTFQYDANTVGTNAGYSWKSEKMGNGRQTITKSVPNQRIETRLEFDQGGGDGYWDFKPNGNKTDVTWGFKTDVGNNPIGKIFMALTFKSAMNESMTNGLNNIASIVE